MPLPFALDHINLWLLRERRRVRAGRLRLRRRADARAVGAAFRRHDGRRAARAHHRHALPPGPLRQRRVADGALRLPDHDDAGRVPDRARHLRPGGDARACRHLRALPPPRHVRRARRRARRPRQSLSPRRPRVAGDVPADDRRRPGRRRRSRVAGHSRLRPFAGTRGAVRGRRGRADLGRHAAAEDHDQRRRVAGRARRRSAGALPALARRVRRAAARHARAAVARLAVPRDSAARRAAARAPRRAARRAGSVRRRRTDAAGRRRRPAGAVPPSARPAAALLRHGRGDRPPQSPVARRAACAHDCTPTERSASAK